MNSNDFFHQHQALRFWLTAAAIVIVIAGLREAYAILAPFLFSTFIAILCAPPLLWMQRKGFSSWSALFIVISSIFLGGTLLLRLVSDSLNEFLTNLPLYQASLKDSYIPLTTWLNQLGILHDAEEGLMTFFNPENLMQLVGNMLGELGSTLTNSFFIFLTTVFILLEISSFPTKLQVIYRNPQATFTTFDKLLNNVQRYMIIKTFISLLTGALVVLWVAVLRVDFALLWGMLAFLLNYVPNIGSLIAAVPAILLGLVQWGVSTAVYMAIGYAVINGVIGNILEPRMMGRGLDLSTLVVFLSLVFWGWVLGPVGMLLSVPLTMTLKVMLERYEETRWIGVLLGSEETAKEILQRRRLAEKVKTAVQININENEAQKK